MIANNTLHHAYDQIADTLPSTIPFFHAVHLVRDHLVARGLRRVLLLGTLFTMENGFYAAPLEAAGIQVEIPTKEDRQRVQAIQSRLAKGEMDESFASTFRALLARHETAGCEAVVTACTELPLVINQSLTSMAVIDPLVLQCRACVDFALA